MQYAFLQDICGTHSRPTHPSLFHERQHVSLFEDTRNTCNHRLSAKVSPKQQSAGAQLINITELVEKILLDLPEHDLIRLQQVYQIHSVTKGSLLLRRKLFLEPEPLSENSPGEPRFNPLLFDGKRPFIDKFTPTLVRRSDKTDIVLHPGQEMPSFFARGYKRMLTFHDNDKWTYTTINKATGQEEDMTAYQSFANPGGELIFTFNYVENTAHAIQVGLLPGWDVSKSLKHGSCRKMLLLQPPSAVSWRTAPEYSHEGFDLSTFRSAKGQVPAGTRLGDLADDDAIFGRGDSKQDESATFFDMIVNHGRLWDEFAGVRMTQTLE